MSVPLLAEPRLWSKVWSRRMLESLCIRVRCDAEVPYGLTMEMDRHLAPHRPLQLGHAHLVDDDACRCSRPSRHRSSVRHKLQAVISADECLNRSQARAGGTACKHLQGQLMAPSPLASRAGARAPRLTLSHMQGTH